MIIIMPMQNIALTEFMFLLNAIQIIGVKKYNHMSVKTNQVAPIPSTPGAP